MTVLISLSVRKGTQAAVTSEPRAQGTPGRGVPAWWKQFSRAAVILCPKPTTARSQPSSARRVPGRERAPRISQEGFHTGGTHRAPHTAQWPDLNRVATQPCQGWPGWCPWSDQTCGCLLGDRQQGGYVAGTKGQDTALCSRRRGPAGFWAFCPGDPSRAEADELRTWVEERGPRGFEGRERRRGLGDSITERPPEGEKPGGNSGRFGPSRPPPTPSVNPACPAESAS